MLSLRSFPPVGFVLAPQPCIVRYFLNVFREVDLDSLIQAKTAAPAASTHESVEPSPPAKTDVRTLTYLSAQNLYFF